MTLLKPTLKVNRLIAYQNSHVAFNCRFHAGVNVVRGRNSSGKTTVMDLLAFSLGAENIRWKAEALQCTDTFVEVELNGRVATFRREISDENQRPMFIFWGGFEDGLNAEHQHWERYAFKRSVHQMSFSQAIFNALEIPIAQGDGASNLTLHQLLRVLYADQPSVHSPIFRADPFDTALTRETIGGYLSGVYDDDLYSAQLQLRHVTSTLSKLEAELKGIFNVLGRSGQSPDLIFSNDKVVELEEVRDRLVLSMSQLKATRKLSKDNEANVKSKADDVRSSLNAAKRLESQLKDELESNELEIGDSLLFVRELEERLKNLDQSDTTRSYLGNIEFQFCPCCLANLKGRSVDAGSCHLCMSDISGENAESQLLRMRNELLIQLKESNQLIESRSLKSEAIRRELPLSVERIKRLEAEYKLVAMSWSSDVEIALEDMARKLGNLDEEIRQAYEAQKLASVIADLQKKRNDLSLELNQLEDRIRLSEMKQEARKLDVARDVESNLLRLLKKDLPLQADFVEGRTASFSFVDNTVSVNGSKNFSESSAVVLRHLFHLAFFTVSMQKSYMRLPRFMMLDGIDDGGMEKDRSHRLQEIIVEECESYSVDYQLIYATSEINPDFEKSDLVVGRAFTPQARSLDIK